MEAITDQEVVMKKLIIPAIISIMLIGNVNAQSPWVNGGKTSFIMLDWDKPFFNSDNVGKDISAASSVLFLTGRYSLTNKFRMTFELPISHYGVRGTQYLSKIQSTDIGNIYIGGELNVSSFNSPNDTYIEFGVRIPTRSEIGIGNLTGGLSENDRKEAFFINTWSIPIILNLITPHNKSFAFKFRLGSIYDIYTDKIEGENNDLHLIYGISALVRKPEYQISLGLSGRNHIAGNQPDFINSGLTQIRARMSKSFNKWSPGLYVRKSLGKNYRSLVDWAVGLTLKVDL